MYICNCSVLCYFCRMNLVDCHIKSIFYVSIFCTSFFVDSLQNINAVASTIASIKLLKILQELDTPLCV